MQGKLLRVIQNRKIQRVGSPEVKQIHLRSIAATNRDLRTEVLGGRFREDLFYRLRSIQIRIPSQGERLEDIPLLVQFFLKKYNDASCCSIPGPATCGSSKISFPMPALQLPETSSISRTCQSACNTAGSARRREINGGPLSLDEVRKVHVQRVLDMCQGNRLRAAHILEIGRTSLYRYLQRDKQDRDRPARREGAVA
jgi:transcriptional regulator with PAS, ATPase and Fis domain